MLVPTLRTRVPADAVLRAWGTRVFIEFSFASVSDPLSDPLSDPDFESFFERVFERDLWFFPMIRGDCGGAGVASASTVARSREGYSKKRGIPGGGTNPNRFG